MVISLRLVTQRSVEIGTIQRRLAWHLRKDDTHKSNSVTKKTKKKKKKKKTRKERWTEERKEGRKDEEEKEEDTCQSDT